MFTRCPDCNAIHPLNSALLAQAGGSVRCGRCRKRFNALDALFDHWPDPGESPARAEQPGEAPTLGLQVSSQPAQDAAAEGDGDEAAEARHSEQRGQRRARIAWAGAGVLLALVLAVNIAWTFREALLGVPAVRGAAEGLGWVEPEPTGPFRDPAAVQLVSRDMHRHPTRANVLVLTATVVNRAERAQPFPRLEVTLLDTRNEPVARRVFAPREYLGPGQDPQGQMAPDLFLPVLLELVDPGEDAVGFQLEFL